MWGFVGQIVTVISNRNVTSCDHCQPCTFANSTDGNKNLTVGVTKNSIQKS